MPKLGLGVVTCPHLIASATVGTGLGSDAPHFAPLLIEGDRSLLVSDALADAGFDSQHNHRLARD